MNALSAIRDTAFATVAAEAGRIARNDLVAGQYRALLRRGAVFPELDEAVQLQIPGLLIGGPHVEGVVPGREIGPTAFFGVERMVYLGELIVVVRGFQACLDFVDLLVRGVVIVAPTGNDLGLVDPEAGGKVGPLSASLRGFLAPEQDGEYE